MADKNQTVRLKPAFEDEFPDSRLPSEIETELQQGRINAHEARLKAGIESGVAIIDPEIVEEVETESDEPDTVEPAQEDTAETAKGNKTGAYGSFVVKDDGTPDGRFMNAKERRQQDALADSDWKLR